MDDVMRTIERKRTRMKRTTPPLRMLRSRHRWRLQDLRPAAMFLMKIEIEEPEAGVDDSGENEKAEKALTRGPEDCHPRHPRHQHQDVPHPLHYVLPWPWGPHQIPDCHQESSAEIATSPSDAKESSC